MLQGKHEVLILSSNIGGYIYIYRDTRKENDYRSLLGYRLGLFWENGKENGNY